MPLREVGTCARCRDSKRRCNKAKPSCARCMHACVPCYYDKQQKNGAPPSVMDAARTPSSDMPLTPSTTSSAPTDEKHDTGLERTIKRRDRACLSCMRCHRLKVKCDRKHPCCSRCASSGHGRTCIYTHKVQLDQPVRTVALTDEKPDFLGKRGPSHWRALLWRVSSVNSWFKCAN
jgi:hypothetical protein